ncbi:MAG: hypothetical protein ACLQU5_15890, partial [Isosphaeraceae bacterium]
FGDWFGTDPNNPGIQCLGVDSPEDIIFNDEPCMPPSYGTYVHDNIPLGKAAIIASHSVLSAIAGRDRYLACLVVISKDKDHFVAWSVPWEVTFRANVNVKPLGAPVVSVAKESLTKVNFGIIPPAQTLVGHVMKKQGGANLKKYRMR